MPHIKYEDLPAEFRTLLDTISDIYNEATENKKRQFNYSDGWEYFISIKGWVKYIINNYIGKSATSYYKDNEKLKEVFNRPEIQQAFMPYLFGEEDE